MIGGYTITNQYGKNLREMIGADKLWDGLQTKHKWSNQTWANIAIPAFKAVAEKTTLNKLATRSKIAHGWLNLGTQRTQLVQQDKKATAKKCPCCLTATEDFVHLLTCPNPRAAKPRYKAIKILGKKLRYHPGGIQLAKAIKTWTHSPTLDPPATAHIKIIESFVVNTYREQGEIGWENLFRGYITSQWGQTTFEHMT